MFLHTFMYLNVCVLCISVCECVYLCVSVYWCLCLPYATFNLNLPAWFGLPQRKLWQKFRECIWNTNVIRSTIANAQTLIKIECECMSVSASASASDGNMNWHNRNAWFAATQCQAEAHPISCSLSLRVAHLSLGATRGKLGCPLGCKHLQECSRIRQACINYLAPHVHWEKPVWVRLQQVAAAAHTHYNQCADLWHVLLHATRV